MKKKRDIYKRMSIDEFNLIAKVNSGIQIINMELTSTKEKLEFNYSNDYNNKIDDAYYKRKECLLL